MSQIQVPVGAKEATISIVVTRANGDVEHRGVVCYWHKNPLKRLLFKLKRRISW